MSTTLTSPLLGAQIKALLASGSFPILASTISQITQAQLSVGSAAGQISSCYANTLSISSGSPVSLDMTALTDPVGGAINFARVQGIFIQNNGTLVSPSISQVLTIGGGSDPALGTDSYTVQLNGFESKLNLNPGFVITSSVNQYMKFTVASGTNVKVIVILFGNLT